MPTTGRRRGPRPFRPLDWGVREGQLPGAPAGRAHSGAHRRCTGFPPPATCPAGVASAVGVSDTCRLQELGPPCGECGGGRLGAGTGAVWEEQGGWGEDGGPRTESRGRRAGSRTRRLQARSSRVWQGPCRGRCAQRRRPAACQGLGPLGPLPSRAARRPGGGDRPRGRRGPGRHVSPAEAQPLLLTIRGTLPHAFLEDASSTRELTAASTRAGGGGQVGCGRSCAPHRAGAGGPAKGQAGKLFWRGQATGQLISWGKSPGARNVP